MAHPSQEQVNASWGESFVVFILDWIVLTKEAFWASAFLVKMKDDLNVMKAMQTALFLLFNLLCLGDLQLTEVVLMTFCGSQIIVSCNYLSVSLKVCCSKCPLLEFCHKFFFQNFPVRLKCLHYLSYRLKGVGLFQKYIITALQCWN